MHKKQIKWSQAIFIIIFILSIASFFIEGKKHIGWEGEPYKSEAIYAKTRSNFALWIWYGLHIPILSLIAAYSMAITEIGHREPNVLVMNFSEAITKWVGTPFSWLGDNPSFLKHILVSVFFSAIFALIFGWIAHRIFDSNNLPDAVRRGRVRRNNTTKRKTGRNACRERDDREV